MAARAKVTRATTTAVGASEKIFDIHSTKLINHKTAIKVCLNEGKNDYTRITVWHCDNLLKTHFPYAHNDAQRALEI